MWHFSFEVEWGKLDSKTLKTTQLSSRLSELATQYGKVQKEADPNIQ